MAIKFGRPLESRTRVHARRSRRTRRRMHRLDLPVRMRRNRRTDWARRMVRENVLTATT
jgi:porphobilinogen synthase